MSKQVRSALSEEAVDGAPELTPEEEQGIEQALASLKAGKGRSLADVRRTMQAVLTKRR
jgi:hypothetical protein